MNYLQTAETILLSSILDYSITQSLKLKLLTRGIKLIDVATILASESFWYEKNHLYKARRKGKLQSTPCPSNSLLENICYDSGKHA